MPISRESLGAEGSRGLKFRYHFQSCHSNSLKLRQTHDADPHFRVTLFMATILVVDDELGIRALLSEILSDEGHTVEVAENAAKARA